MLRYKILAYNNNATTLTEKRSYDKFGRLTEIDSDGKSVVYSYNHLNQLERQIIDNVPVDFTYTKYGQLESKILGGKHAAIANLEYRYGSDGTILGRSVDGKYQTYHYDRKGQLLAVRDDKNLPVEEYVYDPAGNILKKTVSGKTTVYTYDAANQLKTSVADGITTEYAYDAAGRLVKEGDKSYTYGWLDKILNVKENGTETGRFDYYVDGQLALAAHNGRMENFVWDGLALIKRGESTYVNEPYATGGNPILNGDKVLFNDILGTTLGVKNGENFNAIARDSFGETSDRSHDNFFTGKPLIGEIGYAFLFRNYRADAGKWQTADPLGYPDGWNNFAYVNNMPSATIDVLGMCSYTDIWGMSHAYDVNNPPDGVITSINICPHETVQKNFSQKNCLAGSNFDVDCKSSKVVVVFNAYFHGVHVYSQTILSYDCGEDVGNHNGNAIYEVTYNFNYTADIEKYACGQEKVIESSKVYKNITNVNSRKIGGTKCEE